MKFAALLLAVAAVGLPVNNVADYALLTLAAIVIFSGTVRMQARAWLAAAAIVIVAVGGQLLLAPPRIDEGRDAAFHVRRSTAKQLSVDNRAGMRVDRPWLRAERHRIEMTGKSDRQFPGSAADAGNDLCAVFAEWDDVDREASFF